ncbi:acyl-CoA dehydrogenase family protein [Paraburkholderia megapolitana]|uniref:Acyl-CoA dehydrogenase n=1 Tax=Paraburkholderia megapolitana TaxID=420953 RepID=A0A1I3EUV7_9BURK|nr:acyl-CoA dehydrogenase family protein [Paraburkholderia megapolitana]QDQ80295.1 acyl-CoA dehydrogenase family protein [Paraburkholderia megapolitana]SFI02737.1 Acyl-CoA dehydrogenase [Paraburkholderia megapolitana]
MLFGFSDDQLAIQRKYLAIGEEIADAAAASPEGFDFDGWRRLRDEGLWRLIVPTGALDADWWTFTAALDGLSSSIRTPELLLSVIAQAGMVRALERHGNPAQKDRYLDAILRGDVSATCIAEPTTGTDVRSIETSLTEVPGGYRLNGTKFNIAHAPIMDFALVVCRLHGKEQCNIELALLDRKTAGLSIGQVDDKLGNRNLPTGEIHFHDVEVPHERVLGKPGHGLSTLIDIISLGRLYYGLVAANLIRPYLVDAMNYAATRTSFKSQIDSHQYVQRRLVDLRIGMERSRWLAYGALSQLLTDHPEGLMMSSIAKLVGAEDLIANATNLMKLYGSLGYHNGRVAELMKNALGFASVGGTEEMHRKNIFNQMKRLAG